MRGKTVFVLLVGSFMGFIGGLVLCLKKILESNDLRKALSHIIADKIDKVLYDNKPRNHKYYSNYSAGYLVQKPIFQSRTDAEKVIDSMKDIIKNYGVVTIADYYELVGIIDSTKYTDNLYGWTESDITEMNTIRVKDGYSHRFPLAVRL